MSTQPRQLPELVRRFTQDIYMCVYIQPDVALYGRGKEEDDGHLSLGGHSSEASKPGEPLTGFSRHFDCASSAFCHTLVLCLRID